MLTVDKVFSIFAIKTKFNKSSRWLRCLGVGNADQPSFLLIALFAFASMIIIGYRFAVWDQLLYLSFVDRYFQPILDHPGDLYISHFLWHSYTTFWMLIYPIKQLFGWEWPLFIIHVLVKFFIFWGVWSLAFALTKDRLTAWLSVLLMLMNKAVIGGGVNFYMADTITRYVALPFMLFGIKKLWDRKYLGAALLFGIGVQIHILTVTYWFLAIIIGMGIYRFFNATASSQTDQQNRHRHIAKSVGLFLLLALPIIIWFGIAEWGASSPPANADFIDLIHNHFGYVFLTDYDSLTWKTLFLFVVIIVVALRYLPQNDCSRWYLPFTFAIIAVMGIHFLAADVFFCHPILKHQMCRIIDLLGLLTMFGAARILAVHAQRAGWQRWLAAPVAALFLVATVTPGINAVLLATATLFLILLVLEPQPGRFTIPAFLILLIFIFAQLCYPANFGIGSLRRPIWTLLIVSLLAIAILFFTGWFATLTNRRLIIRNATFVICLTGLILLVAFERIAIAEISSNYSKAPLTNQEHWDRMVHRTRENLDWPGQGMQTDWIQFQLWIRDNTPPGTMFFVPPGLNGFRVFSQRNAFFEGYDCEPTIFNISYATDLLERMKVLGYSSAPASSRNAADKSEQIYYAVKPSEWQELSQQWDVPYLIMSRPVKSPFQKLYQRGDLTLWRIPTPAP